MKKINKRKILKYIGKVLAFGLILCILLTGLSVVMRPKRNDRVDGIQYSLNEDKVSCITGEPKDSIDILFLGDSESYCSFIPLQFWMDRGWTSFNMGIAGQHLFNIIYGLEKALETQSPKLVVLETNCIFRRCSPEQSWYSLLEKSCPGIKYHDRWKVLSREELSLQISNDGIADYKGYYYADWTKEAEPITLEGVPTDELKSIPVLNLLYMKRLVGICRRNGIELMLVTTPNTLNHTQQKYNSCVKLAEDMGLLYVDLNKEANLQIDWTTDSRDGGDHLNEYGAQKVTGFMEELFESRELPDHRGEAGFEAWDLYLKGYLDTIHK